jgi:N-acetylglutamate synthase-like GNAT family acetyltransferase
MNWQKDEFTITTDKTKLDIAVIHSFLTRSYWATGISSALVQRSIDGSLCFGVFQGNAQIGFARVITDFATFGYLADVFILEEYRGKGLSKWLMEVILDHPELQGFRRLLLATRDAHGLYRQYGFTALPHPEIWMQIHHPEVYKTN